MGIIAFRLCTKIDTHHQFRWPMQVVLVALASLIVVLWLAGWRMPFVVRCSSWWWLVSCLTIVCLYASEAHFPAMRRFFNHKIFSSLGSLSFTFYMWHQVCIRVYTTLESKHLVEMNHYAAMALLLAIVLLLSWTSNKYFTRPLVKRFAPSTRR